MSTNKACEDVVEDLSTSVLQVTEKLKEVFTNVRDFKSEKLRTGGKMTVGTNNPSYKTGLLLIMKLRQLNRESNFRLKDRRERTQERKLEIDNLYLQLQNLRYEEMQLQKEITNCLEFESKHEDIQLHSEEEFLSLTSADYQVSPSDPHRFMLNRLEFELEERKRLASRRIELEASIKEKISHQQSLGEKLSSLKPSLENLRSAAVPLQEFFSTSFVLEEEQYLLAKSLPLPLYMLYVQCLGYGKSQDEHLSFSIVGDKEEAMSFQLVMKQISRGDESDMDDASEEGFGKKKKRKLTSSEDTEPPFVKAFPLSVSVTISDEDGSSVVILFQHLPFFHVTCASVSNISFAKSLSDGEKNCFIDKVSFLHCLYEGDSGRTSPNAIVSNQIRKYGGDNFSAAVRKYGFPFKWVQRVCGIDAPSDVLDEAKLIPDRESAAANIAELIQVVRDRLKMQLVLARQLSLLDQLKLTIGEEEPSKSPSQLVRWSHVSLQEVNKLQLGSAIKFNLQERINRFFLAIFQYGQARMQSVVCVTPNYPLATPVVSVGIELSEKQREHYNTQLNNIEAEINLHCLNKLPVESRREEVILLTQIRRLKHCFESYVALKNEKKGKSVSLRGKGRLISLD